MWILLHSWGGSWDRRFLADIAINIALYIPMGMSGFLAFRKMRLAGPLLIAVIVSGTVEMLQLFTPTRVCSAFDFVNNVGGCALGVGLAGLFERLAGPEIIGLANRRPRTDTQALSILFCGAAALLFPFYPELHLLKLRAGIAFFAHAPIFSMVPVLSMAASWFVAGILVKSAGFRNANVLLGPLLLLLPAQFLITSRQPIPAEFIGAIAGFILFLILGGRRLSWLGWSFLLLLLIRGLAPFHLAEAHPFIWVPFEGFLDMDWQAGIQVLLEKIFYYGAAIWLLHAGGMRWHFATALVATELAVVEAVQTRLPGRTAEITEPILGLLIGCGLYALNPRRRSGAVLPVPVRP